MSLGYIGLYEVTKLMKGVSHTDPVGEEFALRVMNHMKEATDRWRDETNIGFSLYGTPAESLCYRFARIDLEKFGEIKDITRILIMWMSERRLMHSASSHLRASSRRFHPADLFLMWRFRT